MRRVRTAIAFGVVGLAGVLGGCESVPQQEGYDATQQQQKEEDIILALLGGEARRRGDTPAEATFEGIQRMRQAERSRSQVNVYQGQGQQPPQAPQQQVQQIQPRNLSQAEIYVLNQQEIERQRKPIEIRDGRTQILQHDQLGEVNLITCNYFADFNGDGALTIPDEFVGIKVRFSTREQILVNISSRKEATDSLFDLRVLDSFGNDVKPSEDIEPERKRLRSGKIGRGYGAGRVYRPGGLEPGNYTAVFKYAGEFLGRRDIEVVRE